MKVIGLVFAVAFLDSCSPFENDELVPRPLIPIKLLNVRTQTISKTRNRFQRSVSLSGFISILSRLYASYLGNKTITKTSERPTTCLMGSGKQHLLHTFDDWLWRANSRESQITWFACLACYEYFWIGCRIWRRRRWIHEHCTEKRYWASSICIPAL